jgi:hypothetical protein
MIAIPEKYPFPVAAAASSPSRGDIGAGRAPSFPAGASNVRQDD